MKVYRDEETKNRIEESKEFGSSIGLLSAELNEKIAEELRLNDSLNKLAKQLMNSITAPAGRKISGINFNGITFNVILEKTSETNT